MQGPLSQSFYYRDVINTHVAVTTGARRRGFGDYVRGQKGVGAGARGVGIGSRVLENDILCVSQERPKTAHNKRL